ncbi:hypothetical protein LWI29_012056 [Acer saccharum]|uniref:Bulb-type lectin domain-containing protein n=1 Tax=Acer saccharum TaxID=4024 RepID=A0AA39VV88_ACESA|nr:hypothetical protein LWI29_012056 [Acer saccharum]
MQMQIDHFLLKYYFIIFSVLLSTSSLATAQQRQSSNISRGSYLTPTKTSSWLSSSGLYAFGFYPRGNGVYAVGVFLDGIPEKTVVWTSRRDDQPVSANANLFFTAAEGRLVLQTAQGQDTNITDNEQTASYASMLDTGNFVLYNSDGYILWQSFKYPTDTLLPTQTLLAGMEMFSSVSETDQSTGIFRLKMQSDGNLVQYPKDTEDTAPYAYWSAATFGAGDKVTLNLDVYGHLYLLNATSFKLQNLTSGVYKTRGTIFMMRIDSDGLFRLYSHSLGNSNRWSIVWNSTDDRCQPKGLCGLNSFCFLNDLAPACKCLPGFALVNQDNRNSDCERNFTLGSCKGIKNTLEELDNTIWEDVSYSDLSQTSKEDCSQSCLVDCNCDAALFKDGVCRKQRLPFRYGKRTNDSNIALIKVEGTSESSNDGILPTIKGKKEISTNCLSSFSIVVDAATDIISQGQIITPSESIISAEDPSLGTAELKMETKQPNEYFLFSGSQMVWRSGVWNGKIFTMVPEMQLYFIFNFGLYSDENETYFTYSVKDSTISRLLLDMSGQVKQLNWLEAQKGWFMFWSQPRDACNVHAYCGPFTSCSTETLCQCLHGFRPSDNSKQSNQPADGCVRRMPLQCEDSSPVNGDDVREI